MKRKRPIPFKPLAGPADRPEMRFSAIPTLFAFLWLLAPSIPIDASPTERLQLSETFSIDLPRELGANLGFMPSLGGFLAEGTVGGKKISVWIKRTEPDVVANEFSVKRFWNEAIGQTQLLGEISEDFGCQSAAKYVFRCHRRARGKSGNFSSEQLLWNGMHDLVVVRVMSPLSYEEADRISDVIRFSADPKMTRIKH